DGETEARAVTKVGRPGRDQADLVERQRPAEVHLHPLDHVGLRGNRTVVTVRRTPSRPGKLRHDRQLLLELAHFVTPTRQLRTRYGPGLVHQGITPSDHRLLLGFQRYPLPQTSRRAVGPVAALHPGENGLEAVVVLLGDRIEFVVVAAGTV